MFTLAIFIVILSVLVLIHEFGHYYAARKVGVRVEEFGFGLPPRAIGKKIGETIYSLNFLPFGGFVRLSGDDVDEDIASYEEAKQDPRNFVSKTPGQRTLIIVAGVFMNLMLAIALYYVFFLASGFRSFSIPLFFDHNFRFGHQEIVKTVVMGIAEGSAAETSGIEPGEAIIEIDGIPVYNLNDVRLTLDDLTGKEVSVILMDVRGLDREIRTVRATVDEGENGNGILGVFIGEAVTLGYWNNKILSGPLHAANMGEYTVRTLGNLIKRSFEERDISPVSASVAGPVGIFSVVGGIVDEAKQPVLSMIDLIALLSITLAIINILPLPALDGGRLIFVVAEKIRGKRIDPKLEVAVHKVGMIVLLVILALVTMRDISRII